MEHETKQQPINLGRKIMQMRELLGIRQEAVAEKLGISQQAVSKIEQKEHVDDVMLDRVAKALGVNAEAIKNLDEKATVFNVVQNNYEGATNHGAVQNYQCTFNLLDKWVEAMEENKKLYEELLKSEREKVTMLQKLLEERK
ncbi:MAG: helix-turn-helix transcriptional regulator [Cytophagales bacterium]|nr:helix-turn-helix transcriptional regulator [Cytophagales bacterium]